MLRLCVFNARKWDFAIRIEYWTVEGMCAAAKVIFDFEFNYISLVDGKTSFAFCRWMNFASTFFLFSFVLRLLFAYRWIRRWHFGVLCGKHNTFRHRTTENEKSKMQTEQCFLGRCRHRMNAEDVHVAWQRNESNGSDFMWMISTIRCDATSQWVRRGRCASEKLIVNT